MREWVGSHHYILKVRFGLDGKRDDGQKSQDDEEASSSLYNARNTFRSRQR